MARRTSNKIEPAVMTFVLKTASVTPGNTESFTADLSQIASIVNRRFYRQGLNWAVAGFKIITAGDDLVMNVKKLPNTWVMSNAWEKSMRTWMRMNNEALSESESVRPRFLDFKIYADELHHSAGFSGNLIPLDSQLPLANEYQLGEWEPSKVSIPLVSPAGVFNPGETVERELLGTGASYPGAGASGLDALSLIEGYAASRGLPNIVDPNTPSDAPDIGGGTPENWMTAIFNEGTDQKSDILEDMISENNIAPYPFENDGTNLDTMYPGGANQAPGLQIHDIARVTGTTLSNTTRIKGGNFPCGLVRFDLGNAGTATSNMTILIDMVPGNHRGYLCEPMTEM
ncbi:hypothetical protein OAG22_03370 [Candidatus Poseidoniaceae archaeon]|nr:hypothetical protein [Candidatus Poseidoniaceae archaeon]